MISFFSEHTAEFALTPQLANILKEITGTVVPIYYWASREGNSASHEIHQDLELRVLSMFPRRPKSNGLKSDFIEGKINGELHAYAQSALMSGIPTIAGLPVASSLKALGQKPKIIWIGINGKSSGDVTFLVDTATNEITSIHPDKSDLIVLDNSALFEIVNRDCKTMSWSEASEKIRGLRLENHRDNFISRFFYMSGYKLVYFLLFGG